MMDYHLENLYLLKVLSPVLNVLSNGLTILPFPINSVQ